MNNYEVVVAGAGPVGLLLACELALKQVKTLMLERLAEPSTTIKAGALNIPGAEALYRRGLLPKLVEIHQANMARMAEFVGRQRVHAAGATTASPTRVLGHFAGLFKLDPARLDPSDPDLHPTPASSAILVPQQALEMLLAERARALGVEVRRGISVEAFSQDAHGVYVRTASNESVRAAYLVGCDGGRSMVRKLAGFEFPGTAPTITGYQAMATLADPEKLGLGWHRTPRGVVVYGPVPGRILTVEFEGAPDDREKPVTSEEVQASLRRVSGTDVTITALHTATRFTDNARQASSYRKGRVLLAGDAAHVHSPFGGQGLNLGLGDAMNLGWKLAAVLRGESEVELLDTYSAERHPIGARVLEITRAQVALLRPDDCTSALRTVVSDLMDTDDGNTYFTKMISGIGQRYDFGQGHLLLGRRAPDLVLSTPDGEVRLGDLAHDGRALLLDLGAALGDRAAPWGHRVRIVRATCPDKPELAGLFVRPDGFVAWAADRGADSAELAAALTRWCGSPQGDTSGRAEPRAAAPRI